MKNTLTLSLTIWCLLVGVGQSQQIKFFTDKPNSVPVGSDFMLFQRNNNYVNSTVSQMKQDWFNNPVFSGNGGIQGVWTAVAFVGDGSQLTGITTTATNTTFEFITNNILYSTNIYATNITVYNLTAVTNYNTYNFSTNLYATTINSTTNNLTFITNYILYSTNIYATNIYAVSNFFTVTKGGTLVVTNTSFSYGTNEYFYTTNLYSTTNNLFAVTNNYFITTNIVIQQPGGFQNNNLTPNSLMKSDALDNEVSVANGTGALTNNNSGGFGWYNHFLPDLNGNATNMSFWGSALFDELDVNNGYFTNAFTFLTNAPYLATDANGKIIATTTPSLANATNEVTRQINSSTNIYASLGTAISDLSLGTNLTYKYTTNNSGSTTLDWGVAYRTNLAANVTIALQSVSSAANAPFYQTIVYWVTNSSASDRSVTSPSGCIGPVGSGTPSVLWATNKTLTRFLYEHYGPNDITVSKTDYGN